MMAKLRKYETNLNSKLARLALALDPSIPNTGDEVAMMTDDIRSILVVDYDYNAVLGEEGSRTAVPNKKGGLLAAARATRAPDGVGSNTDEIAAYFEFTKKGDESCKDAVEWWGTIGRKRFPTLAKLARDTLMCMGSSVPSESSFSDCGNFVTADRGRLSDGNIETMMKLRSWNRLFKAVLAPQQQ
jgi:hypothetical protein